VSAFRVFLSAVTSEFGPVRDALANDLQSHDIIVCVQRSFRHDQNAGTLLHKLRNYIQSCDAVIFLIGARSGAGFPTPVEAEPFRDDLPSGVTEASYTQWEMHFACKFGKRRLIYFATDLFPPDKPNAHADDRPDLQAAFIAHVKSFGSQWTPVGGVHEFRAEALKDILRAPLPPADAARLTTTLAREAAKPILLPYPSLGPLFKGRDSFMRRLHDSLHRPNGGAAAIACSAAYGMGGVGKTRTAVEYAWAHRADYSALALLDAETPDRLRSNLAALAGPLRLPAQTASEEDVRYQAVLDWLNGNPRWFLILDNIDSEPALAAAHRLLGRLEGGHVVLTSRLALFPREVQRLDLDVLTLDDATAFLLEATPTRRRAPDDDARARALAQALGQLALALEIAAATIEARRLGLAGYDALWQGNRGRVIGWAGQAITGYHHAVAETWQTSVDQLTPAGRALLERLAFLAPEPVPVSLLDVPVPGAAEAVDAHAALDDLTAYSLAARDAEGEAFLLHRLVMDVTRRALAQAGRERQRLTEALGWVDAAFAGNPQDVRTWKVLTPLTPHAEAVAGFADAAGIAEPTVDVMSRLATLLRAQSQHRRAEPHYRRALAIAEANFPPSDPRIATHLNNLATLLQATNRLGEAEPLMRRALAIDETSYGADHPEVAIDLNNLAALLQATNRLGEAEPLMRRMVAIFLAFQRDTGHAHPHRDAAISNYAALLTTMGKTQSEIGAAIQALLHEAGAELG
jgi:tetratricopeptide (TPR) repeat protein